MHKIFLERHAPSKDISYNFAVLEHLRYLCSGGAYEKDNAVTSCGQGLKELYNNPCIQQFLNQQPNTEILGTKPIYQPGCLRKLSPNTIPSKLSEINIAFCYDNRTLKLQHVTSANDVHLFLHHYPTLSTDTMVLCHGAVFSTLKMLEILS